MGEDAYGATLTIAMIQRAQTQQRSSRRASFAKSSPPIGRSAQLLGQVLSTARAGGPLVEFDVPGAGGVELNAGPEFVKLLTSIGWDAVGGGPTPTAALMKFEPIRRDRPFSVL